MLLSAPALIGIALQAQLIATLPRTPLPKPAPGVAHAGVHQNTAAAGRLVGATLTLEVDIVESGWRPEGASDPEVPILAFAEHGKAPTVPGPLVRVPLGTTMLLTLRNLTDSALVIGGLRSTLSAARDTIQLPKGGTRDIRVRFGASGTFAYWGAFLGTDPMDRLWKDSQLNGAIVVDAPGTSMPDRVLVVSEWFYPYDENRPFEVVSVINGKGWPYTETIHLTQNDSTRFRVVNMTSLFHPFHLHGFFYRIESKGDGRRDLPVAMGLRHLSNTDLLAPGSTVTFSFLPATPGNWLFHCHFSFHTDETVTLSGSPKDSSKRQRWRCRADHTGWRARAGMRCAASSSGSRWRPRRVTCRPPQRTRARCASSSRRSRTP
ncbi:MAG: multicopper oxidase domain-containing protein [Gemmatimonadetes bacterium]|nr:multicopper oxidase domain-containing protein [Gemmatimonadota bacterium]